jgi:maltose alpha-D-glucosyltransferase/alpha-amylase
MKLDQGLEDLLLPEGQAWLQEKILPNYVKNKRWFAAKDKHIERMELAYGRILSLSTGDVLFAEIKVTLDDGEEVYQLPICLHLEGETNFRLLDQHKLVDIDWSERKASLVDAFELDRYPLGLLDAIQKNSSINYEGGQIISRSLPNLQNVDFESVPEIRRLSGEQSNSSLVIGERIIVKLVRRVSAGINPEVEMVGHLTEQGYKSTPPLLGDLKRIDSDGREYSLVVFQEFIGNQGDAWKFTLAFIHDYPKELSAYIPFARIFGQRLAELHKILALPSDLEAFSPRFADEFDVAQYAESARQQVLAAFSAIECLNDLADTDAQARLLILQNRDMVLKQIPALAAAALGTLMTRIHGDFHLGQILISDQDAFIIDFEGEPSKPVAVRRSKASPLRDVAGLLRSLDYAMAGSNEPETHFVKDMSAAVLESYRSVEKSAQFRWMRDDEQDSRLLDLFLLEKSAYEICYEAANRPSWLSIPLRGFAETIVRVLSLRSDTIYG